MNTNKLTSFLYIGIGHSLLAPLIVAAQDAIEPSTAPPQPSFGTVMLRMFPMFVIVFLIFYFMVVKPENVEKANQAKLVSELKKGAQVVTSGGIVGKVHSVGEEFITLDLEANARMKVEKSQIARKL